MESKATRLFQAKIGGAEWLRCMLDPEHLLEKMEQTAAAHRMWSAGDTVVVAVSGGPDSVAMLHMLARLRSKAGLSLVVAHLHHGLRGADADADAAFVERLATSLDVPRVVERVDVGHWARQQRLSV